ncbi:MULTISPECIES: hypothetical protein [unclassified Devosia]|uniref:hypothetical protein n=1 Tax=unclassified Devosia TaxID=196773 RepID=UPI001AD2D5EB|nr:MULTISPECIES: hypothetical protein [unclassified Devosia]MBN9365381.1 hypothetical protein [Devosia sp.]
MRTIIAAGAIALALCPALAAEAYRVTPYFECLVGKGVSQKVFFGLTADEAMDYAITNCASADPGMPPADQDAVDNREYMRVEAYDVIDRAEALELQANAATGAPDNTPLEIGLGN